MKHMVMPTLTVIIAVLALASFATADVPQMINYQGRLTDSTGAPLDTTVSMVFTIYDAATNGSSKWTETHPSVDVVDGLFNVILGDGTSAVPIEDSVFNQPDRWLGITVGGDPELTPRTQFASVAYAKATPWWSVTDSVLYTNNNWGLARGGSFNALFGDSVHTMVNLGISCTTGTVGADDFYATIGGGYRNVAAGPYNTICGGKYNEATGAWNSIGGGYSNNVGDSFSVVAGGYNNTASGHESCVGGGYWNIASGRYSAIGGGILNLAAGYCSAILGGYCDTISSSASFSYLFGINSNLTQDSTFMVDMPHIRFGDETNGYEFPTSDGTDGQVMATDGSGQLSWTDLSGGIELPYSGSVSTTGNAFYILNSDGSTGRALHGVAAGSEGRAVYGRAIASGTSQNYGGYFEAQGTYGVGVYARANSTGEETNYGGQFYADGGGGRGVSGWAGNSGSYENYGGYFLADGGEGRGVFGYARNSGSYENYGGQFWANGVFGIGVQGKAFGSTGKGVYGSSGGNSGSGVMGEASSQAYVQNYGGYFVAKGGEGRGVYGTAQGIDGCGVFGEATNTGDGAVFGSHFLSAGSSGRAVNAEATGPSGSAVHGTASNSGDYTNYGGRFQADGASGRGVYGWATNSGDVENYGGYFEAHGTYGRGVYGLAYGSNGFGGYFEAIGTYGIGVYATGGPSGYAADFKGNVRIRSHSTGNTVVELGEGLDFAEGFDISESTTVSPGSVLIIDSDNPGKLKLSSKAYDSKVAGIVAGAKGLGSGVRLGTSSEVGGQAVALAGRVYCNVDTHYGDIEPGDLLTTSPTPGHAMVVKDFSKAQGTILGKAMERLSEGGTGQILVLVTLQ